MLRLFALLAACSPDGSKGTDEGVSGARGGVLALEPDVLDFGYVAVGNELDVQLVLRKIGDAPLEVASMETTDAAYTLAGPAAPFSLAAGEVVPLTLTLAPVAEAGGRAELRVLDSAGNVLADAALYGTSVPPAPVAICEATTAVAPIGTEIALLGSGSYALEGETLVDWDWALSAAPTGSSARLTRDGTAGATLTPDLVGEYVATLIVTDAAGLQSDPCSVTVTATDPPALRLVLTWAEEGDDFDLHLVREPGELESDDDCYYANCSSGLDWGAEGEDDADPLLELDDIPGTGPEQISIRAPEYGTFTVWAHDYPGSVLSTDNTVTLSVQVDGAEVWSTSVTVAGEDTWTELARIEWPAGTVSGP